MATATTALKDRQGVTADEIAVSADSHVIEPHALWEERMPAALRDRAPKFGAKTEFEIHPGGNDPNARLTAMVEDGVSAEILFPSLAMTMYALEDVELQEACFKVYNDWLAEYCSVSPRKLVGVPAICTYNIPNALKEIERSHAMGLQSAVIWLAPDPKLPFHSHHYDELWRFAEQGGFPVTFHILTGFDHTMKYASYIGGERSFADAPTSLHLELTRDSSNTKILGCANTIYDLIFSGVFDRFPEFKIALVEGDVGWIPFFAHRWEYYFDRDRATTKKLELERAPSECLKKNFFFTFVDDPAGAMLAKNYGIGNWMWASDFPHAASSWPNSRKMIEDYLGYLAPADRKQVLSGTAATLWDFEV